MTSGTLRVMTTIVPPGKTITMARLNEKKVQASYHVVRVHVSKLST